MLKLKQILLKWKKFQHEQLTRNNHCHSGRYGANDHWLGAFTAR